MLRFDYCFAIFHGLVQDAMNLETIFDAPKYRPTRLDTSEATSFRYFVAPGPHLYLELYISMGILSRALGVWRATVGW